MVVLLVFFHYSWPVSCMFFIILTFLFFQLCSVIELWLRFFILSIMILFSTHFVLETLEKPLSMSHLIFLCCWYFAAMTPRDYSNLILCYVKGRMNGCIDMLTWQSSHHPGIDCKETNNRRQLEWTAVLIYLIRKQVISFSDTSAPSLSDL